MPRLRFDPDSAPNALDDTLADSQADAGTGKCLSVRRLKNAKNLLVTLRLNLHTIVGHSKNGRRGSAGPGSVTANSGPSGQG